MKELNPTQKIRINNLIKSLLFKPLYQINKQRLLFSKKSS